MTRVEAFAALREVYAPMEALSRTKEVWRLRHKKLERDLVFRSYPHEVPAYAYLQTIRTEGFPEVYDVIGCEDGFVVLEEFVSGKSLDGLLKNSLFSYRSAAAILKKAALSLSLLHQKGFVHRDIKPSNLLITPSGGVYLLDLETIRTLKESDDTRRLGTPGFAAPEQYVGASTAGSDVYALGVTLNVMLTGRHPSESLATNKKARRIIQKATAMSPDDRYPNAAVFAAAL